MMRNANFILKALFILKVFCPDFFGQAGKRLIRKLRLILKFMLPYTGRQVIVIHMLPNLSRKSNQPDNVARM